MVACVFSSLADITQEFNAAQRTKMFGLCESTLWCGLLVGPLVGGVLAQKVGLQQSYSFAIGGFGVQLLLLVVGYRESRWISGEAAVPFSWSSMHAFGSLYLLTTNKTSLG